MRIASCVLALACGVLGGCAAPPSTAERSAPSGADTTAPGPQAGPAREKGRLFSAQDLGLLDAPDREEWQRPAQVMDALKIAEGSVVADLGAGGGWFTIRLARRVEQNGLVYAEDVQEVMGVALRRRVEREGLTNVKTVIGTATDPKLPEPIDAALIVDAYHEMQDPADPSQVVTLLKHIEQSLKREGCLGIVDFEPGGGGPGPDPAERVTPDTIVAAAAAAGLTLVKREPVPPFQFLLVFGKANGASRCAS